MRLAMMRAMVLERVGSPLQFREIPEPAPATHEVLIRVSTCGVCRTDLHIVDGELPFPKLPLVLGHQVVGTIEALGEGVEGFLIGERVGVPWLGKSCGRCPYCLKGQENLCDNPTFTGYTKDGGYAEKCVADSRFIFPLPARYTDIALAPLLCAGLIGYRAYRLVGSPKRIGFFGFGSSAHILAQVVNAQGHSVYAFTRTGDLKGQEFARSLGAVWAGDSETLPPEMLDAAILFAPVGALYPQALKCVRKGGHVISAGIHMSPIPSFPYSLLWEERSMSSVANLTREDGREFLKIANHIPIRAEITTFSLEEANAALDSIRTGKLKGSAVLQISR